MGLRILISIPLMGIWFTSAMLLPWFFIIFVVEFLSVIAAVEGILLFRKSVQSVVLVALAAIVLNVAVVQLSCPIASTVASISFVLWTVEVLILGRGESAVELLDRFWKVVIPLGLSACVSLVAILYQSEHGIAVVVLLSATVFARDIAAGLYGKFQPTGHVIVRKISPKKHFEGLVVGGIAAVLVGAFVSSAFVSQLSAPTIIAVIGTAAIGGGVGDLFESILKRLGGKECSSAVFGPQQGGVLEAFDGFIVCAPLVDVLAKVLG